jgi:acetyl esterase
MPVDPHIQGLLDLISSSGYPPLHEGTPEAARQGMRAMTCGMVQPDQVIGVGDVQETVVPGGEGDRAARVYRPAGEGPWPTVLFLHGGGFVVGDLDTHDQVCRRLCRDTAAVVVSLDYRLAPEHPFPAAVEDAVAAGRWVAAHLGELGGGDRMGVAGDSAGGNLAATVAQDLRGRLAAQLLVYPAVDVFGDHGSREENASGYLLEQETLLWFFTHYAGTSELDPSDPRHSPLHGELAAVAPAVVVTAGYDPLRDEGSAYAAALEDAGVEVRVLHYDDLIHGFFDMAFSPTADRAIEETVAAFRELLRG